MPQMETEHQRFRRGERRRYLTASAIAVLALVLFAIFGPSRDDVKKRFEFSGAEGPLKIMPELSIDEGADAKHKEEQRRNLELPEPAPNYEVFEDNDGPVPVPEQFISSEKEVETIDPEADPELDDINAVEMNLPAQTNPWFRLIRMVRPRYPADATAEDRLLPMIRVEVAFFVSPEGTIQGSYIISNEGSEAFARITLKAVDEWLYEPVEGEVAPQGFWNRLTLRFRQPTAVLSR